MLIVSRDWERDVVFQLGMQIKCDTVMMPGHTKIIPGLNRIVILSLPLVALPFSLAIRPVLYVDDTESRQSSFLVKYFILLI